MRYFNLKNLGLLLMGLILLASHNSRAAAGYAVFQGAGVNPFFQISSPYTNQTAHVLVGGNVAYSFTIQNVGTVPLTGLALNLFGPNTNQFATGAFGTSQLNSNQDTAFTVKFLPVTHGVHTATVNLTTAQTGPTPFQIYVTVDTRLSITQQPADVGVCAGGPATFSVGSSVDGGHGVSYQWQRRGAGMSNFVDVAGAIGNFYSPPTVATNDAATFRVILSGGGTNVTSAEATLSVVSVNVTSPTVTYDFNGGLLTNTAVYGHASATNNVLQLNDGAVGRSGAFRTGVLAPGERVGGFVANFRVRIGSGNGYADGFSFNWATDLPAGLYAKGEEGEGNGLRVCFDTYDNGGSEGPAIDVKWGTNTIGHFLSNNNFLPGAANDFADVAIRLNPNGTLDVLYRCVSIFAGLPLPGYTPLMNARFGLGARTGLIYESHTIDDLVIELHTTSSILDASVPGDPAIGTSANSTLSTVAAKAIDNNVTSKYLNFDKLNSGLTITVPGERPVRALTLVSAEDVPDRDPSSFVLEGSNDGTNFTRIASNGVPAFPTRHFIQSFAVANADVFNSYRVLFPTVSNAATANSMQIAEVELLHHGEITSTNDAVSITLPPGAVDVRGVGSLFDRQLDGIRKLEVAPITNNSTIVNITLAAGAKVLKGFELIGAADDFTFPQRRPSSVTVAGSIDGITYTNLTTVVPAGPSSNLQIQEFATTSNATAFAHYRITFGPPVGGDRLQVGEMRLFGEADLPAPVLSVRANGNNVLVSWPDNPGYALETRADLNITNWTTVATAPVLSNGLNTATLPMNGTGFFRLRK